LLIVAPLTNWNFEFARNYKIVQYKVYKRLKKIRGWYHRFRAFVTFYVNAFINVYYYF